MALTQLPNRKADAYSLIESQCPQPITNRTYLGIWNDRAVRILRAYLYHDGEYQHTLGMLDYHLANWAILGDPAWVRAHNAGDTIVFKIRFQQRDGIATWTPGAPISVLDTTFSAIGGPVVAGAHIYFQRELDTDDARLLQLYKVPLHASGTLNEETARFGDPLEDEEFNLSVPTILCHTGGETFQVPCFWFGDGAPFRVPWFEDGVWSMGEDRDLVSGTNPGAAGDGYAAGQHSLRLTYRPGFQVELGLMPGGGATPNTPEIGLLPALNPAIKGIGGLSVSPSGQEAVLFPFYFKGETGNDQRQHLFRLRSSAPYVLPAGCPLPRLTIEPGPDNFAPPSPPEGLPEAMLARD